jgi:hypothetical protein
MLWPSLQVVSAFTAVLQQTTAFLAQSQPRCRERILQLLDFPYSQLEVKTDEKIGEHVKSRIEPPPLKIASFTREIILAGEKVEAFCAAAALTIFAFVAALADDANKRIQASVSMRLRLCESDESLFGSCLCLLCSHLSVN